MTVLCTLMQPWASKRCSLPIPSELIAVVAGSLIGTVTTIFDDNGLRTIGDIPTGLQVPKLPPMDLLPLVSTQSQARYEVPGTNRYTGRSSRRFYFASPTDGTEAEASSEATRAELGRARIT